MPFWGVFCHAWDGTCQGLSVYLFEVSSFNRSRFTEGSLKFKNSAPGPWPRLFLGHFVVREMGLARIYPYTKSEVSSFTRSKDTAHVPLNGWMHEGVCPNSRVNLRRLLPDHHQIWRQYSRMVSANVLDFRYVFDLMNTSRYISCYVQQHMHPHSTVLVPCWLRICLSAPNGLKLCHFVAKFL